MNLVGSATKINDFKNNICLNVQSPEFIPDSSFSSSNGENTLNNISVSEIGGLDSEGSFTGSTKAYL